MHPSSKLMIAPQSLFPFVNEKLKGVTFDFFEELYKCKYFSVGLLLSCIRLLINLK